MQEMPHSLLPTGNEGKNQEGDAMVGTQDDMPSSACGHQAFVTRNEMSGIIVVFHTDKCAEAAPGVRGFKRQHRTKILETLLGIDE